MQWALFGFLALATGCRAADPAGGLAPTGLFIELREGYFGDDGEWWLAVQEPGGPATAVRVVEAPDGDAAERAFDTYFARCLDASERAHDVVVREGIPSWLESPQYAREWHIVVPNAELTAAVAMSVSDHCNGVFDLGLRRRIPDPEQVIARVRSVATWSGDGSRLAFHALSRGQWEPSHWLVVVDGRSGEVVYEREIDHSIDDIAWSPNGSQLAVLCSDERLGRGPLDSLTAALGHGVPYADFVLLTIDLATGAMSAWAIEQDIEYGEGFLLWDERSVRSMAG